MSKRSEEAQAAYDLSSRRVEVNAAATVLLLKGSVATQRGLLAYFEALTELGCEDIREQGITRAQNRIRQLEAELVMMETTGKR